MIVWPVIDERSPDAVIAGLAARARSYLGVNWIPGSSGSGQAVLNILAGFSGLVIERLNQVPDRDFLAFLDAMGVGILPPQAARAPLVFRLAAEALTDLFLPSNSEVAAVIPPALPSSLQGQDQLSGDQSGPLIFATEQAISLTRARLASVYSTVGQLDVMADHSPMLTNGLHFFGSLEQVPHHLYLGHDTLFDLPGAGEITINVALNRAPVITSPSGQPIPSSGYAQVDLTWEYLTAGGWMPFGEVHDRTGGMSKDGSIILGKTCGPALKQGFVHGIKSFWIRARVDPASGSGSGGLPQPGDAGQQGELPVLDTLRARVKLLYEQLALDAALSDGQRLDATKDFFPFGSYPRVSGTFLFACDDAFQRVGATIGLNFALSSANVANPSGELELTWEYSTAGGWQNLGEVPERFASQGPPSSSASNSRSIFFLRPADWAKSAVEGQSHFWLRIRISKGDYGGPTAYATRYDADKKTWTIEASNEPKPPIIAKLTASYSYETEPLVADHCIALNNFVYTDYTEACRWGRQAFRPFQPVPDREPAIYLGFDQPLPIGLVSLFAEIPAPPEAQPAALSSSFRWEYRSAAGWSELAVRDETLGFVRSGIVQFIGPPDLSPDAGPSQPLFWIRAVMKIPTASPTPLPVNGLHLNAAWATQRRSVRLELLGHSDGSPRIGLRSQHAPVLSGERLEVQEWTGTGHQWETLFRELSPTAIRQEQDARGNVTAVWIRWDERPHLFDSGPGDRHYTIERTNGLIRFGDGISGMVPPPGAAIVASYDYGGGPQGNVTKESITQLHSAVPYVESVFNPVPASGGADAETLDAVRRRGNRSLRARNRALAAEDFECLAREASAEVALARCRPTTGPLGEGQAGWVTLVVAPFSGDPQPAPSAELMHRVRSYLEQRAPAGNAGRIRVVAPSYLPITVTAEVVVTDIGTAALIEEALGKSLAHFLHPLLGGPTDIGWGFGQAVHLSQVARLIRATSGVAFAVSIQLTAEAAVFGDYVPLGAHQLPSSGHHLLKLRAGA